MSMCELEKVPPLGRHSYRMDDIVSWSYLWAKTKVSLPLVKIALYKDTQLGTWSINWIAAVLTLHSWMPLCCAQTEQLYLVAWSPCISNHILFFGC